MRLHLNYHRTRSSSLLHATTLFKWRRCKSSSLTAIRAQWFYSDGNYILSTDRERVIIILRAPLRRPLSDRDSPLAALGGNFFNKIVTKVISLSLSRIDSRCYAVGVYCVKFKRWALTRQTISQSAEGRLVRCDFSHSGKIRRQRTRIICHRLTCRSLFWIARATASGRPLEFVFSQARAVAPDLLVWQKCSHCCHPAPFHHPSKTDSSVTEIIWWWK